MNALSRSWLLLLLPGVPVDASSQREHVSSWRVTTINCPASGPARTHFGWQACALACMNANIPVVVITTGGEL